MRGFLRGLQNCAVRQTAAPMPGTQSARMHCGRLGRATQKQAIYSNSAHRRDVGAAARRVTAVCRHLSSSLPASVHNPYAAALEGLVFKDVSATSPALVHLPFLRSLTLFSPSPFTRTTAGDPQSFFICHSFARLPCSYPPFSPHNSR